MLTKEKFTPKYVIPAVLALLYMPLTFILEKRIFHTYMIYDRLFTYISIKILTFAVLYAFVYLIIAFFSGIKKRSPVFQVVIYALPYTVILLLRRSMCDAYPLSGDELNIYYAASMYSNLNGMFNYLTTYIHMIALQIYPSQMSMIIFKHILCGLEIGYVIYRINRFYNSKWGCLVYLIFFVPYVIDISWSVHRMQMYGPTYFMFAAKLYFDYKENRTLNSATLCILAVLGAMLSQWRMEGIYLIIFCPLFICLAYHIKGDKKAITKVISVCLLFEALIYIPQWKETVGTDEGYTAWRSSHLYNFLLPNMMRNGIDREKNSEILTVIDKYVPIEDIDALNNALGSSVYYEEFMGLKAPENGAPAKFTLEQLEEYEQAVMQLVIKNPFVYFKTQVGAFLFISASLLNGTLKGIIYTIAGNLIFPAIVMFAAWIIMLCKKQWFEFSLLSAPLLHAAITTAMLPAAYFKYYYMQYILAYSILVLVIASYFAKRKRT